MSEENTAAVEVQATTAEAPSQEASASQATQATQTTEPAKAEAPAAEDYSWVPSKFMVDGKPDFTNLAKSYQSLEKKIGQKVANLAPESIDDYTYQPRYGADQVEALTEWKNQAKELGLTPKQYEAIMSRHEAALDEIMFNQDRVEAQLKEAWGKDFDSQLMNARRAFDEFAPSNLDMNDPALNHPAVLQFLARIGAELGEDTSTAKSSPVSGMSEDQVKELMKEPDYWKNREKQALVTAWYEKKYK